MSPWLFLAGLLFFLGSLVLFVVDLVRGVDVLRAVVVNAASAVVLILWAALDTLSDPDSEVASPGGAAGTALLLYGIYLLFSGSTIAVTGLLFHAHGSLGLLYIGLAIVAVVVGFGIFPRESVVGSEADNSSGKGAEIDDDRSSSPAGESVENTAAEET